MADFRIGRIRINTNAIRAELRGRSGRRYADSLGRRLVTKIKSLFPRGRSRARKAQRHAADTITFRTQPSADGIQLSVRTVGSDHAIFVEEGSRPVFRTVRGGKVLLIIKPSGEKRFRTKVRHPGTRGKEPFKRGAESLGLKVRPR